MPPVGPARAPEPSPPARAPKEARAWFTLAAFLLLSVLAGCHHAEPLPTLGQVGDFALVDQQARPVSAASLRGKVWVAAFFFTRCPTICPRITRRMRALQITTASSTLPL